MTEPYVVVCQYDEAYDTYGLFLHEADLLLIELDNAVSRGALTVHEAMELWEPYRELSRENFEPENEYKEEQKESFPTISPDADSLPATHQFEEDVHSLVIPGAGYVSPRGAEGRFLAIKGKEALEGVCKHLHDRYRIVVLDGSEPEEYWKGGPANMLRVIAWARKRAGIAG